MSIRTIAAAIAAAGLCIGLASCGGGGSSPLQGTTVKTLSNRADLISGGSALVEVVVPAAAEPGKLRADVDGVDVTSSLVNVGGRMIGLVRNLKNGANNVNVTSTNGS